MGFEAGFDIIAKPTDIICSFEQMLEAKARADFESNSWMTQNYKSFDEYAKSDYFLRDKKLLNVDRKLVEFYKQHKAETVDFWCSVARLFDDELCEILKPSVNDYYDVNLANIDVLCEFTDALVERHKLVPVRITHGIKNIYEYEDDDEPSMQLTPVDGVQLEFEDGSLKQLFCNEDWETACLYVSRTFADDWDINAYTQLQQCVNKLKTVDFINNFAYYWRSY